MIPKLDPFDASEIIKNGGNAIYPTEGIYGIGCDPFNESSVENIFKVKGRDLTKNFIILTSNINYLKAIIGARTNNSDLVFSNLKTAIEKDADFKTKASKDREFVKYFLNADFKAIFRNPTSLSFPPCQCIRAVSLSLSRTRARAREREHFKYVQSVPTTCVAYV